MSQELNQPNTPGNQQNNSRPQRNNTMIYWIIIAILLIACIYMFVSKRNLSQQHEKTVTQLTIADSSRQSVENDYNAALARLDQLTSKNAQMDSMINDRNGEVAKLKSQIQGILSDSRATANQLAKAKKLIDALNGKTKSYEERIAELESENSNLNNQNTVLTHERDSTVTRNIALKQLGSVLHASNIRMYPTHIKRNGHETETGKAKKVDLFRIVFDIDENRVAENGTKDLYVRIMAPDNTLLSNAAYGSGMTPNADGTSQINYTIMKQVALQQGQPVKDVTVDWHQESDYKRGTYSIEIYNGGYKIGSGQVTLK